MTNINNIALFFTSLLFTSVLTDVSANSSSGIDSVFTSYLNRGDNELTKLLNFHNNRLTVEHGNFFKGENGEWGKIYTLGVDEYTQKDTPNGLVYTASSAVGYGLANSIILTTEKGIIVVDTGSSIEEADERINQFQSMGLIPQGEEIPLKMIIYTHNHIDHTGGVDGWLQRASLPPCPGEDLSNAGVDGTYYARTDCVEVLGQVQITNSIIETATRTGNIIDMRSEYMYGSFLNTKGNVDGTTGNLNCGIGPKEQGGNSTYYPMSKSLTNWLDVRVLGLQLWLRYAPSETEDEIVIFLPDDTNGAINNYKPSDEGKTVSTPAPDSPYSLGKGLLLSAEVIQGPSFPNLYTLRGTTFRNPLTWYESVDLLRQFQSWGMVPSHGVPLMGPKNIQSLLLNFRDAIAYVHDQSLRLIRLGYIPDEVVTMVNLPNYILNNLAKLDGLPEDQGMNPLDYLRTFYGSVPQSVREIYAGYLGWNEGDPTLYQPLPPLERSRRYVMSMGGVASVLSMAQDAYETGVNTGDKKEFQWCAEILIYVIRSNPGANYINLARLLKAKAFLQLAQTTSTKTAVLQNDWWSLNPIWRNWLITGALELLLAIDEISLPNAEGLIQPQIMSSVPPANYVQHWCWRFNPQNNTINGKTFGWEFNDNFWIPKKQRYVLEVAGCVVRFHSVTEDVKEMWDSLNYAIKINYSAFSQLLAGDLPSPDNSYAMTMLDLLNSGDIKATKGSHNHIAAFYDNNNFDQINRWNPPIVGK